MLSAQKRLTAVVFDGEVGALSAQAETEGSLLVVFICGPQSTYHLRKGKKKKKIKLIHPGHKFNFYTMQFKCIEHIYLRDGHSYRNAV